MTRPRRLLLNATVMVFVAGTSACVRVGGCAQASELRALARFDTRPRRAFVTLDGPWVETAKS